MGEAGFTGGLDRGRTLGRALDGVTSGPFGGEAARRGVSPLWMHPCLARQGHVGEAGDFPRGVVATAVQVLCTSVVMVGGPEGQSLDAGRDAVVVGCSHGSARRRGWRVHGYGEDAESAVH